MIAENEFLDKMREILDNQDVRMETVLSDIEEWDSLSVIGYVSLANSVSKKKLSLEEVRACATISDLHKLLG